MQTALPQTPSLAPSAEFARSIPGRVILALAATLVVAAAAHVSIPLWFTPVPLTLQPLAVLAVGLALGPVTGFFAMLAYLAEGALGLPVFSPVGPGGVAQLLGPTGGFLMSYPAVAAIAGGIARRLARSLPRFPAALTATFTASLVLFSAGAGWLMFLAHLSPAQTWIKAVAPFMIGAAINMLVSAGAFSAVKRSSLL